MTKLSIETPQAQSLQEPTKLRYKGPFESSVDVAQHYGFHLIEPIKSQKKHESIARDTQGKRKREKSGEWYMHLADKLAQVEHYISNLRGHVQPTMVCHTRHPRRQIGKVQLTMYGCTKSIAEALVIHTAIAILKEQGHDNLQIDINSVGEGQSKRRFREKFVNHVKERLEDIHPAHQKTFKNDALLFTTIDNETCREVRESAPRSIEFLSSPTQRHLKEVLEYLESLDTRYRINNDLVGSDHHDSHTIFQIKRINVDDESGVTEREILARGERHETLPEKLGYPRTIPTVSISIDMPGGRRESYKEHKENEAPKVYYAHLGMEAKRRSIPVLEELRQAGIEIVQALTEDRIREQIQAAKNQGVLYAIIMGVKEAQEDSVIVRHMPTRSQQTMAIERLPGYLRQVVR